MKQHLTTLLGVAALLAPISGSADTYTPLHQVTEIAHCTRYAGPSRREGPYQEIVTRNGQDYTGRLTDLPASSRDARNRKLAQLCQHSWAPN
jgi:hypothetical protein